MSTIAKILLVLTIMPIVEISILIPLHNLVGGWATVGIVVCTALLGTILIRWQGGQALNRIKETMAEGQLPGEEILDGVLILLSSVTLITPGVITDTIGLFLLVPTFRAPVRRYLKKRIAKWIDAKTTPSSFSYSSPMGPEPVSGEQEPDHQVEFATEAAEDGANLGRPDDIL